jgi:predicted nuclease of predicted toxin-antitoxin system
VNPLAFPLLADENIHPDVIAFLRQQGYDIQSVVEEGLVGQSDLDVLQSAHRQGRVVLTHDSDFGTLVVAREEPFSGIIYLRPGHIRPTFTIQTLETLAAQSLDVMTPFIVVAERREDSVQVRVRRM